MRMPSTSAVAGAALVMAIVAAPARAQNFQNGSAETILYGNLRFQASPVQLFGTNGGPDRTGGAFRLGYGLTDSFDVEAKTGFFNGFSLLGADGRYQFRSGDTSLAATVGGHQALVQNSPDSTALDLAATGQPPGSGRDSRSSGAPLSHTRPSTACRTPVSAAGTWCPGSGGA